MIKPFFDPDNLPEEERNSSGISYKDMMKQRRQKQAGGLPSSTAQVASPPEAVPATPPVVREQPPAAAQQFVSPQTPVIQTPPPSPTPQPIQTQSFQETPAAVTTTQTLPTSTNLSDPEDSKRKIRTLMGMILKHRGGPGFGKGRLKGREIEQFDNLLQEVTGLLRVEAAQSSVAVSNAAPTLQRPSVPQQVMTPTVAVVNTPATSVSPLPLDSMIACIEGAILMYKNSPAELKSTVMVTLRAALAAAVKTCDSVIGSDPNPIPTAASQVDGTIAVIEGAVSMYRNSPPELQSSVLITLRAALRIAVSTCDSLLGAPSIEFVTPVVPTAPVPPVQSIVQQVPPTVPSQVVPQLSVPAVPATDRNSKALNEIYEKVKAASGEGRLGLRSDLTSEEASELADGLMEMRGILMEELEAGIPDPEPETTQGGGEWADTASTASKYQQMLAKAKNDKAGNA